MFVLKMKQQRGDHSPSGCYKRLTTPLDIEDEDANATHFMAE